MTMVGRLLLTPDSKAKKCITNMFQSTPKCEFIFRYVMKRDVMSKEMGKWALGFCLVQIKKTNSRNHVHFKTETMEDNSNGNRNRCLL